MLRSVQGLRTLLTWCGDIRTMGFEYEFRPLVGQSDPLVRGEVLVSHLVERMLSQVTCRGVIFLDLKLHRYR